MADSRENGEILRFLAASVESIRLKVEQIGERTTSIQGRIVSIEGRIGSIEERMATKDDITMVRGDIERVDLRLDGIDRAIALRLDTMDLSVSRLRSAVYLLSKDQPEIQKLLGQS
jgi:hypothetical protein